MKRTLIRTKQEKKPKKLRRTGLILFFFSFLSFVKLNILYPMGLREGDECLWKMNPTHVHRSIRETPIALHSTCSFVLNKSEVKRLKTSVFQSAIFIDCFWIKGIHIQ